MVDAILVRKRADQISFEPAGDLSSTTVQLALEELDAEKGTGGGGETFAMHDTWTNVKDHDVSMSAVTTTLASTLSSGSTTATVVDASTFAKDQDMAIPGAGASGVELIVTITLVVGNAISFSPSTSTTVSAGVIIYHDDTRALNAILQNPDYLHLYGDGFCYTTGTLTMNVTKKVLVGPSQWNPFNILPRNLTADVLVLAQARQQLKNITINHINGLPTSGVDFAFGTTTPIVEIEIDNIFSLRGYTGVEIGEGFAWNIDRVYVVDAVHTHMRINSPIPWGGHIFGRMDFRDQTQSATYGLHIVAADWMMYQTIKFHQMARAIYIDASVEEVIGQEFGQIYSDNTRGDIITIKGNSSQCYVGNLNAYCVSGSPIGVKFESGATYNVINSIKIRGHLGTAFYDAGNYNAAVSVYGQGVSGTGVHLASTSRNCTISGGVVNGNNIGLQIDSGATDFNIYGLNFATNTTPSVLASGILAFGKIHNCEGINDYLTSVSATPDFIDQRANFGGDAYIATGTSSSADWKQVTP